MREVEGETTGLLYQRVDQERCLHDQLSRLRQSKHTVHMAKRAMPGATFLVIKSQFVVDDFEALTAPTPVLGGHALWRAIEEKAKHTAVVHQNR